MYHSLRSGSPMISAGRFHSASTNSVAASAHGGGVPTTGMENVMPLENQFGVKLTKRAINLLETRPGKNYIVFDTECPASAWGSCPAVSVFS